MKKLEAISFREKENNCESIFVANGPYWHMYTDGNRQSILFTDSDDMRMGLNLFAVCAVRFTEIKVYTMALMNNHLHCVLSGSEILIQELFDTYKSKLQRSFARRKRVVDIAGFECKLFRIKELQTLRNEIVYTNRNGYLVHPDCTPFSYPWGANAAFYNPFLKLIPAVPYRSLTVREKRVICCSNEVDLPNSELKVYDGVILPSSYCYVSEAEQLFRDAHHYFYLLTRNYEAYSEIANRMHELIFLTDEELYAAISAVCLKKYGVARPSLISAQAKVDMARLMHSEYNASKRQIRSLLKIAAERLDELFPTGR